MSSHHNLRKNQGKHMEAQKFILAIDQGTTGSTVAVLDAQAQSVGAVNKEHPQIYPQAGWVEHDPEAIWKTVIDGIQEVLTRTKVSPKQIAAIGITNQRETVVMWDKNNHRPVYNAIVWQCRRTTEFCERLKKRGLEKKIRSKTGLLLDPYFSASKIRWLLDNVPGVKKQRENLKVGTIDSFLLWRLTAGQVHKTDVSNASRTQLMNIKTGEWDADLLRLFQVPQNLLPEIAPSSGVLGETRGVPVLPDGIPIAGMAGDQQSALFGQACFDPGSAKCTFGTGSFLLMNTGKKMVHSKAGLLTTVAWQLKGEKQLTYALEGGAFICGAAVQWLRDQMQFFKSSSEIEALAKQVTTTDGVFLVPAFVGLGAPYWDPQARAAIVGMTRGTSRAHLARATLEAMALQNVDILLAMEKDLGKKIARVRVDGGAASDNLLMQMQADFLGVTVQRPRQTESTVLGAAFLAGLGVGFWPNLTELRKVWAMEREFKPAMGKADRRQHLQAWHQAVERVR
jgi:glycerol kinase